MRCRKLWMGFLFGGLAGVAIVRLLWERRQSASEEGVYELRSTPNDWPATPPVEDVPSAADVEQQAVETETVEQEPIGQEVTDTSGDGDEPSDDVRAEVIDIDEISVDEAVEPDDLRVIEGVGPKISDILNENGIYTYAQLTGTDVDDLRSILTEAGSRFRLADPTTWPQQAQLAADGDWDGLQALQDSLKHGR